MNEKPEEYDPGDATVAANPYPYYSALRDAGEFVYSDRLNVWLATSHRVAGLALASPSLTVHPGNVTLSGEGRAVRAQRVLLFMDPPEHTRARSLIGSVFSSETIAAFGSTIEAIAQALVENALRAPSFDVMTEIALPLPVHVVASLLGIPEGDRDFLTAAGVQLSPQFDWEPDAASLRSATEAALGVVPYFMHLVRSRRRDPQDDLISQLVVAEVDGRSLTASEVVTTCVLVFIAGFMTTANLIGNGLLAMLSHRERYERLTERPETAAAVANEMLRFDSPVQVVPRTARSACSLGGQEIDVGEVVLVLIGSANRDPVEYRDPDVVRFDRERRRLLSFGRGPHYCLGAALAQLEGEVIFRTLAEQAPNLVLDPHAVEWQASKTLRGVKHLRVRTMG